MGKEVLPPLAPAVGHNTGTLPLDQRLPLDYEDLGVRVSEALIKARNLPTEIATDDDVAAIGAVDKVLRELIKEAEDTRKEEGKPYLEGKRTVDTFFNTLAGRASEERARLERVLSAHLKRKAEQERQRRMEAARIAQEEADRKLEEARQLEEMGRTAAADFVVEVAQQAEERANLAVEASEAPMADMARTYTSAGTASLRRPWTFEITDQAKIPLEQLRNFISTADLEKAIRGFVRAGGRQLDGVRIFQDEKASFL